MGWALTDWATSFHFNSVAASLCSNSLCSNNFFPITDFLTVLMATGWPQRHSWELPLQWHLNNLFDLAFAYLLMPFFYSVVDLRRRLYIIVGLSITFKFTKSYANFCSVLFLKSLVFAVCTWSGGYPLTARVCLSRSCPAAPRLVAESSCDLAEDAVW